MVTRLCSFLSTPAQAVAKNMHPSQTVMSVFKEPQKAVTAIQGFLDGTASSCTLLADLSKAFERVNPLWCYCGGVVLFILIKALRWLSSGGYTSSL